tara:strand:+ start:303 stop:1448 length:1146 start_codon:yes stop_codon:yes gene_type:complete
MPNIKRGMMGAAGSSGGSAPPGTPGELWAWGTQTDGQLGVGNVLRISSPTQVGSSATWVSVGYGNVHTGAIQSDGTLWTWGAGAGYGQTGHGNTATISSPLQVGSLTDWHTIQGGSQHMCALKTDGTLWAWGRNGGGQLPFNDTINRSSPVQVGSLTDWAQLSSAPGNSVHAAVKTDGTLWVWGVGTSGALGQNNTITYSSPVQVGSLTNWAQVSSGTSNLAAVKTDGTLWTWGATTLGKGGHNNNVNYSSPVQVGSLTNWASVTSHSLDTNAVKTDGTLWSWGRNNVGQSGLGDVIARSSPVQVGSLTTWGTAAHNVIGNETFGNTITDGTLWVAGQGSQGGLGTNNAVNYSSPVQVGSLTTWTSSFFGFDRGHGIKSPS